MINSARGSHSSPGFYSQEVEVPYSVKSIDTTRVGLVGETKEGPAFEPISITKWSEFTDFFGTTSAEKYKGNGYPKYELPYIAKEYLSEGNNLYICRVLGLSGYDAGKAWIVTAKKDNKDYALVVLRSKADITSMSSSCGTKSGDTKSWLVSSVSISDYQGVTYDKNCTQITGSVETSGRTITTGNMGKFNINVTDTENKTYSYPVSLDANDSDYIYNVIPSTPLDGDAKIWIEEFYDYGLKQMITQGATMEINSGVTSVINTDASHYKTPYQCASTPWIVSESHISVTSGDSTVTKDVKVNRLFKFHTISDGDNANVQVKVSITNINPDNGTFDVIVRDFYDTDDNITVIEKFSSCTMVKNNKNYIAYKIGTYDGQYDGNSNYIKVEMNDEGDFSNSVPAGFLGYPLHDFSSISANNIDLAYNCAYDKSVKARKQYFGISSKIGIDEDVLKFKGTTGTTLSKGFHMDSVISAYTTYGKNETVVCKTDDNEVVEFNCVETPTGETSPRIGGSAMDDSIYKDINARKFTVAFYGGFDGWDIYRKDRTNIDKFKSTQYEGETYTSYSNKYLDLPSDAINSDYYAYLGGFRQFANPKAIDIDVFATPGIDIINNTCLVNDAIDVIEDKDDGRNGDALYVFTTPNRAIGDTEGLANMYTEDDIVNFINDLDVDSSYAATYWPWIQYFDTDNSVYIELPATKDVIRNLASTDKNAQPWFAPAGYNRGKVNCSKATKKTKLAEEDTLYSNRINPITTFSEDGVMVWGNKTFYSIETPTNRVNVRRLMIKLKKLVNKASRTLIFDQYDDQLVKDFKNAVLPILAEVKTKRGLYDYRLTVYDTTENRDEHTLQANIAVKPTPTMEWIDLTFTIYPESVDFADE